MRIQPVIPAQILPSRKRGGNSGVVIPCYSTLCVRPRFREGRLFAAMTTKIRVQYWDNTPP
jgi:hypothetical protein